MATRRRQKLRLILEVDVDGAQAANFLAALPDVGEKFGAISGRDATVVGAAVGDEWQAIRWAMTSLLERAGKRAHHEVVASFAEALRGMGVVSRDGATRITRACMGILEEEKNGTVPGRANLITGTLNTQPGPSAGPMSELVRAVSMTTHGFGQLLGAASKDTGVSFEDGNHAIDSLLLAQESVRKHTR